MNIAFCGMVMLCLQFALFTFCYCVTDYTYFIGQYLHAANQTLQVICMYLLILNTSYDEGKAFIIFTVLI